MCSCMQSITPSSWEISFTHHIYTIFMLSCSSNFLVLLLSNMESACLIKSLNLLEIPNFFFKDLLATRETVILHLQIKPKNLKEYHSNIWLIFQNKKCLVIQEKINVSSIFLIFHLLYFFSIFTLLLLDLPSHYYPCKK